jgi:hypothetical protein
MSQTQTIDRRALFATLAPDDLLGFYEGGSFKPKSVAEFLTLKNSDVSRATAVSRNSVRYDDAIPQPMRERLTEIANICNLVARHFDGDRQKTALWFTIKNPMLGDISPRDMIRFGRYDKLRRFVVNALIDDQAVRRARMPAKKQKLESALA